MLRSAILAAALLLPGAALATSPVARRVTTDDCLAKGMCAYVSPHGRVTCGKCPGQVVKAIRVPAGTAAICANGSFAKAARPERMCRAAGGVRTRLR